MPPLTDREQLLLERATQRQDALAQDHPAPVEAQATALALFCKTFLAEMKLGRSAVYDERMAIELLKAALHGGLGMI